MIQIQPFNCCLDTFKGSTQRRVFCVLKAIYTSEIEQGAMFHVKFRDSAWNLIDIFKKKPVFYHFNKAS